MNVGIIADSPLLTTGFGVEASQAAWALIEAGHKVTCFGLKGAKGVDDPSALPFGVWQVDVSARWDLTLQDFLLAESPDVILILIDLYNLAEIMTYCAAARWRGRTIVYLTPDGIPAYRKYLAPLRSVEACVVTTRICAGYLTSNNIPVVAIAPAGVNRELFAPASNKESLRRQARLEDKFVVGVFGSNTERKQQPRVLRALAKIKGTEEGEGVVVYFHCRKQGYWHLDEIAEELGVAESVFFPEELHDEARGIPLRGEVPDFVGISTYATGELSMPRHFGYVERINCCDVIINAPHSGDFEHVILEAQACGVALANTNDHGIMAEGMGAGGIPLEAIDVARGRIGERIFLVSPQSIADAIVSVGQDSSLKDNLINLGTANVNQYSWLGFKTAIAGAVGAGSSITCRY